MLLNRYCEPLSTKAFLDQAEQYSTYCAQKVILMREAGRKEKDIRGSFETWDMSDLRARKCFLIANADFPSSDGMASYKFEFVGVVSNSL